MAVLIIALFMFGRAFGGQISPAGLWKTVDDKTHKTRGLVRIFEKDGAFFGRIEKTFDAKEATERCIKCEGERHDQPIVGLTILRDMKKRESDYGGGDILDPETGTVYRCKMTLDDGGRRLVVRGFIGISLLGRSQTWTREE
ncbi:MAG: DUF2147 domain-containing protein [Terriglobia bacterium]